MKSILGLDSLNKKLRSMEDITEFAHIVDKANKGIVQTNAKNLCNVNHGELKESIRTALEVTSSEITATTYTNKAYAVYNEFGTGPIGEADHEGISPEITPSYSQHGWGIPADKVDPADAEMYKWPKRTYGGKEYYLTSGQPAQPFLYPALKNNEGKVKKKIAAETKKLLSRYKK